MARIISDFTELIGNTPMVELHRYRRKFDLGARLLAKAEYFNPAGSVKDRIAKNMIEDAEQKGLLCPGCVIVEPTSGNTGIGLAAVAAVHGYEVILTMPETMSVERQKLLKAYGAEIVLTDGNLGMQGAIDKAKELVNQLPKAYMPAQFDNPANPETHRESTGPEIWTDTDGQVDVFVAGVGTGGTITGTGGYLKSRNSGIKVVAVEPSGSPVLSGGKAGPHGLQGIGAGFFPKVLNTGMIDEVIAVEDAQAYEAARVLCRIEGLLIGISSGAALWAATELARRPEHEGRIIVALLPDTGERYLSTPLFGD